MHCEGMLFIDVVEDLQRKDFTSWFRESIGDEDLAEVSESALDKDPQRSKKVIIDFINEKYTA